VRLYAVHLKAGAEPVLMSEGFAWGTFFLGPLWLAAHRAWIAAALSLAAYVLIVSLASPALAVLLCAGVALLLGLNGHDMQGWALERQGYTLVNMVAGRRRDDAWMRLMGQRPDLASRLTSDLP
jgi:Protein of unknown function (DUF2628)